MNGDLQEHWACPVGMWMIGWALFLFAATESAADIVLTRARITAQAHVPNGNTPGIPLSRDEAPWRVEAFSHGPDIGGSPSIAEAVTDFIPRGDNDSVSGSWNGSAFKSHALDSSVARVEATAVYRISISSPTVFNFQLQYGFVPVIGPNVSFSLVPLFGGGESFLYDSAQGHQTNFLFSTTLQPGEYELTGGYTLTLQNSDIGALGTFISYTATTIVPEPSTSLLALSCAGILLGSRRTFRRAP